MKQEGWKYRLLLAEFSYCGCACL